MTDIKLNEHVSKLVEIANHVASSNPLLGYELEQAARSCQAASPLTVTVNTYLPLLQDAVDNDDETKMVSLIKELSGMIKRTSPLSSERSKLLPALVRMAHAKPKARSALLPLIRQMQPTSSEK